jgi:hypothetical protein
VSNLQNSKKDPTEYNRSEFLRKAYEDVWQDRRAATRARTASTQPSRTDNGLRAQGLSKNSDRSQKESTSRRTMQITTWVLKPRGILVAECAEEWGITRSQAAARLIDLGLENKILSANSRLLVEVIEKAIWQACSKFFARLTGILFRMFLINTQTLHLQRNLVARSGIQKKLTPGQVEKIIAWSKQQARSDVAQKNGEVDKALDTAISLWLEQFDSKVKAGVGEKGKVINYLWQ